MTTALGFDIGTTHLKWQLVDRASGALLQEGSLDISPRVDPPLSEQAVGRILDAVQATIDAAQSQGPLSHVAFSAAMHSLIAVDANGSPLTNSLTWMDTRAETIAQDLAQQGVAHTIRRTTGVPLHPMSPWVKWLWLRPRLPAKARPVALKDWIIQALTGTWVEDYSTAAASGFLGLDYQWNPDMLTMAGLQPGDLPPLEDLAYEVPARTGRYRIVVGGHDAALAHLHLGILPGSTRALISLGTSGALRVATDAPLDSPDLFCYGMGPQRGYLVGAAFSNVGNVLAWLAQITQASVPTLLAEGIHSIRTHRTLPFVIPYWYGERFPWWRGDLNGEWRDLKPQHGRGDLAGSLIMAILAGFWYAGQRLDQEGLSIRELVGGSGLLDFAPLAQLVADALNHPLLTLAHADASLAGAVDLARGLGHQGRERARMTFRSYEPQDSSMAERVRHAWERIRTAVTG
jgi:gluconokinase